MGGKVESAESRQYVLVSAQISPCTAAAILTVRIIHQQRVHLSFPCSYHPGHVYTLQLRARCIPHNCPHLPASGFSYFIKHIISYIIKKITPIIKKKTSTPIPVPPISVYPASSSSVSGFPIPVRPTAATSTFSPLFLPWNRVYALLSLSKSWKQVTLNTHPFQQDVTVPRPSQKSGSRGTWAHRPHTRLCWHNTSSHRNLEPGLIDA